MNNILVIDDNANIRKFLAELLTTAGYNVTQAESGDQGIKIQQDSPADLIISDLCMPQKSGIDTIRELKKEFPELKIIAISGGPGSEAVTGFTVYEKMLEAALDVGASITLQKPVPNKVLLNHIKTLLSRNQ